MKKMDIVNNYKHLKQWNYLVAKKKRIDETRIGKKVPNLEIIKIVLVQYNLEDNQYQLKSKV